MGEIDEDQFKGNDKIHQNEHRSNFDASQLRSISIRKQKDLRSFL